MALCNPFNRMRSKKWISVVLIIQPIAFYVCGGGVADSNETSKTTFRNVKNFQKIDQKNNEIFAPLSLSISEKLPSLKSLSFSVIINYSIINQPSLFEN